ncbi:MAG: hypothetical protein FWC87_05280 [Acidimicrobiaceae bacterium]|nr:hypothetical protein [Acidimicrobiaceae bacterium]
MRIRNVVAAVGSSFVLAGTVFAWAGTASATSTNCADNVCIRVVNAARGSNYIETAQVWSPDVTVIPSATYRLLYDGVVQQAQTNSSGSATFGIYGYLPPGLCIQGGEIGVGRSSCWVVP